MLSVWRRSSRSYFSGLGEALWLEVATHTTMVGADYTRGPLTVERGGGAAPSDWAAQRAERRVNEHVDDGILRVGRLPSR